MSRHGHPCRRYFARIVDQSIIWSLSFALLPSIVNATMPEQVESFAKALKDPIIAIFIYHLVWLPTEAGFLALLGGTPGKYIFGIHVAHPDGELLSFPEAFYRTFLVWLQGLGLGIPFVVLFTMIFAYRRLTRTGTTLWDTSTNALVTYQPWNVLRAILGLAVMLAILAFISILNPTRSTLHG